MRVMIPGYINNLNLHATKLIFVETQHYQTPKTFKDPITQILFIIIIIHDIF